jgi:hypothetical protein
MSETRDFDLEEGLAILGLLGAMRTEERTEHGDDGQTHVQINVAQFAAVAGFENAPGRIRTCEPRIRSPLLCPLSYRRA